MKPDHFPTTEEVVEIPIGRLLDNPLNEYLRGDTITPESCAELTASVAEHGINTPLLVTPYRDAFRIVYGHRRKMAAKCAGLIKVGCIIKTLTEDEQFAIMFAENVQRKDLTLRGEARCYKKFADEGKTLPDIERKTGISKPRIKTLLTLLTLEPEVQALFEETKLPIGAINPLSKLTDRNTQLYLARAAAKDKSTLRTIETKVERALGAVPFTEDTGSKSKPRKRPNALLKSNGERQTKSGALALFAEEEIFTLRDITRAILGSCCDNCDENRFPTICAECPISQMLATLIEIKGVQPPQEAAQEIKPANEQLN